MLLKQRINPTDYDRLIAFNQHNEGAEVTHSYLESARAYAFCRPDDPHRWVATYVVNTGPDFRCLAPLTPAQQADALKKGRLSEKNLVEITLLCRDRSLTWLPGEQQHFYTSSIRDALRTGRKHLLGGTTNPDLLPKMRTVLSNVLYAGQIDLFGTPKYGWVIYTSWSGAVWNIGKYLVGRWVSSVGPKRQSGTTAPTT